MVDNRNYSVVLDEETIQKARINSLKEKGQLENQKFNQKATKHPKRD